MKASQKNWIITVIMLILMWIFGMIDWYIPGGFMILGFVMGSYKKVWR